MFSEFFEVEVKEVEKISVDKDTYDFLFYSYFKDDTDPYIACSKIIGVRPTQLTFVAT